MLRFYNWFPLIIVSLLMSGCRESAQRNLEEVQLQTTIAIEPSPPVIGTTVLILSVRDIQGLPVQDARIQVRGDMRHAGMAPEFGATDTGQDGEYQIFFEWTMNGDWILTTTIELPNGGTYVTTFDVTVSESAAP